MSNDVLETKDRESSLSLRPVVHPVVAKFLQQRELIVQLVAALGSPLNVLLPGLLPDNIGRFQEIISQHNLRGRIFFAHKSNQSDSLLRQLAVEKVSVDVASVNELRHALACGLAGERLEATGPKSAEFITLALLQDVAINADSIAELKQVLAVRRQLGLARPARVLLRLCGFDASALAKESRFGIPLGEAEAAFALLKEHRQELSFLGLSFHLDSVSLAERVNAIGQCMRLFDEALNWGLQPQVLNIGGGFPVNYLACENDWLNYTTALKESVLGLRPPLTWQNKTFGLSAENSKLRGSLNSYSYYQSSSGPQLLQELLASPLPSFAERTVAEVLRDNMIELWLEPGRALVEQAGITLARVNGVKTSSQGHHLVLLNMKRQDIAFLDQEYLVDPLVLYASPPDVAVPAPVFFAGDLCLESDLICQRRILLDKLPAAGDIVAFVNTAGYLMDFSASNSIMQPIGRKIAVCQAAEDRFAWFLDEQYFPAWPVLKQEQ